MSFRGINTTVIQIRRQVFTEVARMAYANVKGEQANHLMRKIPYTIIPGEEGKLRKDIFLERAIVEERVRLAMGLPTRRMDEHNSVVSGLEDASIADKYYDPPLVNVIKFACNRCPEKLVKVSDLCQGCLAHPCMEVCPKKAITWESGRSTIDQDKCIKCGRCVGVCPYNAIVKTELMKGAADAMERFSVLSPDNDAYKYAAIRNILYRKGKSVEILECYEPDFTLMNEWYKQLFGESEGKDNKGLFPASCIFSTDLHSMGQFIQEGSRVMFETIVDVKKPAQDLFIDPLEGNFDGLNFLANQNMSVVNRKAMEGTILAHTDGGVPEVLIEVDDLTAYNVGYLIYFFWRACACSGYLLSVNPFNQPGVESYKKNMFALLGKPGYEGLTAELEAKLK